MSGNLKKAQTEAPKKTDAGKNKNPRLSYEKKKGLYGYAFIALWLVGSIFLFIIPLIESLIYSFQEVSPQSGNMFGPWVGLANYKEAFLSDPQYPKLLVEVLWDTALKTPLILIFSLFIAVILNQKFKGRTFARAIFFLPVIIATGPVYNIITGDIATSGASNASQFSTMFKTNYVGELLDFIGIYGIDENLTKYLTSLTSDVFNLVWNAGIQILIFLAALQNIPASAKEAAQMEGATAWEFFWKITFPYVSPMILANLIYTVVDSFTDPRNSVMERVLEKRMEWDFSLSSAMTWAYFAIVLAAVGIITAIVNRFVYYEVD